MRDLCLSPALTQLRRHKALPPWVESDQGDLGDPTATSAAQGQQQCRLGPALGGDPHSFHADQTQGLQPGQAGR